MPSQSSHSLNYLPSIVLSSRVLSEHVVKTSGGIGVCLEQIVKDELRLLVKLIFSLSACARWRCPRCLDVGESRCVLMQYYRTRIFLFTDQFTNIHFNPMLHSVTVLNLRRACWFLVLCLILVWYVFWCI